MLRGTPYIYQGEELGMTNPGYNDISEYRDVESINYYHILLEKGKTKEEALEILGQRSRDNGRSPMQWNCEKYAGFSKETPWIKVPDNYKYINVEAENADEDSILNYYRTLVNLRKQYEVVREGDITFLHQEQPEIFVYRRSLRKQELLVVSNFSKEEQKLKEPVDREGYKCLISNYPQEETENTIKILRPYESVILLKNGK